MQPEVQAEGFGNRFVGDVVVTVKTLVAGLVGWLVGGIRRPNPPAGHDKVIAIAHPAHGLDNVSFIVGNHLDALELDAQREAVLGEVRRVGVDGLVNWLVSIPGQLPVGQSGLRPTFPPSTSSPIIRQAAV